MLSGHSGRVRDLAIDHTKHQVFTCSADHTCKVWDLQSEMSILSFQPQYCQEMTCSSISEHLYAVGSQTHVTLFDSRMKEVVHSFDGNDDGWGVRSLIIHEDILTVGGGKGRISFYDFTARQYLEIQDKKYHTSGNGWFDFSNHEYLRTMYGIRLRNAIYTMAYDSDRTQLFTGGGPLALGLVGSYAAVWH